MKIDEDREEIQCKEEVQSQFVQFNYSNQLILFKIFGEPLFTFQKAYSSSPSDWSGFYTQLSAQHSMRYLTKKWGDGSHQASLLKIKIKKNSENPIKILRIRHQSLGKHQISGEVKAKIIKNHLYIKYNINFGNNNQDCLIKRMGDERIIMVCVDCEDDQVIIPHNLLKVENFEVEGLAVFRRSNDGMLRTISWRPYSCSDWKYIKGEEQFQPHLLVKSCAELRKMVQKQQNGKDSNKI